MTDTRADTPSVVERTRRVAAGAPVVAAHFLGDSAVFVLGEEALLFVGKDGTERRVPMQSGAILAAASGGDRIVTGGDDGKLVAADAQGESAVLATDQKRRWIDHVAVGPGDAVAWSAGKQAFARTGKGAERALELPSTVGGLAFAPKGVRLAIAHYNGLTLWFPNAQSAPEKLEWKGSHLGALISPDGKFVVTSMQEPMLHGWRLADGKDMRMSGYGARVRSLGWTVGGKWLATSGSTQLILRWSRSAMPTGSFSSCVSTTAPRFWHESLPMRRSARSPGARPAACLRSGRKTATPASSISDDARRVGPLLLLLRRALRRRASRCWRGLQRVVRHPVPRLGAAEQ